MRGSPRGRERLVGCFLLGLVLLDPPLLSVLNGVRVLGWPALYLFLFGAWGLVILLVALVAERGDAADPAGPEET